MAKDKFQLHKQLLVAKWQLFLLYKYTVSKAARTTLAAAAVEASSHLLLSDLNFTSFIFKAIWWSFPTTCFVRVEPLEIDAPFVGKRALSFGFLAQKVQNILCFSWSNQSHAGKIFGQWMSKCAFCYICSSCLRAELRALLSSVCHACFFNNFSRDGSVG